MKYDINEDTNTDIQWVQIKLPEKNFKSET